MSAPEQIDAWALTLSTGALLAIGGWKLLVPRRDYERDQREQDRRWQECRGEIAKAVSREVLDLELKPIRDEQVHRARSMETLGKALSRTDRRVQRIEITIAAIATKLGVPHPQDPDAETE